MAARCRPEIPPRRGCNVFAAPSSVRVTRRRTMARKERALLFSKIAAAGALLLLALAPLAPAGAGRAAAPNDPIATNAGRMVEEGRQTFRYDTFGDQVFWSRILGIHEALKTVSARTALAVGLKVDSEALPPGLLAQLKGGAPALLAAHKAVDL